MTSRDQVIALIKFKLLKKNNKNNIDNLLSLNDNIQQLNFIPKRIFQTHKSLDYISSKPKLFSALMSWLRFTPEYNYYFFDDEDMDRFMREKMSENIYKAFLKLPLPVMKADLWRYCIVHYYGGIYTDIDTVCKVNINYFMRHGSQLVIAPENDVHLCQWTFLAPPKSPILNMIIGLSVIRILSIKQFKGEHIIHYLTGPGVFTDGIEQYLKMNNKITYPNRIKYHNYYDKNLLYVFSEYDFSFNLIYHLYTGADEDGWTKDRDRLFK